jgi:ATP-dependent Clp protease ATP-binding subunit ClpC
MPKLKLTRGLLSISLSALIVLSPQHASAFNSPVVRVSSPTLQVLPVGPALTSRGSFVPTNVRTSRALYSKSSSSSALHMVIERLSDECVEAVKQSHEIGNEIGLKELKNEILFAGIVARPERAANTLERFQIQADDVRATAIRVVRAKPSNIGAKPENPAEKSNIALPFADDTKTTLSRACEIADRMESELVRSEHVLLALLGYNNGQKIVTSSVIDVLSGLEAVKNGKTKVSVFDFCEQLVNALPNTPFDQPDTRVRENVVIGGASGNTNTLKEVGVDMTQLALEGRLDMVFGRDKEIRSALRTLGRRRKNNPCLIGDAGTYVQYSRLTYVRLLVWAWVLILLFL